MKRIAKPTIVATLAMDMSAPVKPKEKFSFRVTVHETHYLQVGDVVPFQGRDHVVAEVNDSCARLLPVSEGTAKKVTFTPRFSDSPVTFSAPERNSYISISPNSELEIKHRLGKNWRELLKNLFLQKDNLGVSVVAPIDKGTKVKSGDKSRTPSELREVLTRNQGTHPTKRGRGRPKGSKNKAK